jgi:hypothetical protein
MHFRTKTMIQALKLFTGIFALLATKFILSFTVSFMYLLYKVTVAPVIRLARLVEKKTNKNTQL